VTSSSELVARLWRLCAVLRKDGITYPQYVAELTYLLFLKMMAETRAEEARVPPGLRWVDLVGAPSAKKLDIYRSILLGLGDRDDVTPSIRRIFKGATTVLREAKNLELLIDAIAKIDWFSEGRDSFGELYEGLLQKNAEETKRGAGQYFTPRPVIDVLVHLMQPGVGDVVQDPAAGTGGFLVSAHQYARQAGTKPTSSTPMVLSGMENVQDTYRLLLMNLYLHNIDAEEVYLGDTLSADHEKLPRPTLILTNPPFGPAGGRPARADLPITATVASYQLPFVEHCVRALSEGGRAAIVVPDNVLFDDGRGRALRDLMLQSCDVHTILRLPPGIFYAQGVKTNVIFFTKSAAGTGDLWIYDLRSNSRTWGRSNPLEMDQFDDFVEAFGERADGKGERRDQGISGRFRRFAREDLAARNDNLDISWLRDEIDDLDADLTEPEDLTAAIAAHLRSALSELESIAEEVELDAVAGIADGGQP
jgi:type I restriction enzyme M protein